MEPGGRLQPARTLLFGGILGALLLAQGTTSLQCYSCRDVGDGGCAPDRIKIVECAPPRNVCLVAVHVVELGNLTLSTVIKGCDVGPDQRGGFSSNNPQPDPFASGSRIYACSENLCNTQVTGDIIYRPVNGSKPSVPNGNECYYCLSFSEDQCLAQKDAVMKCHGNQMLCQTNIRKITLGNLDRFAVPYIVKQCGYSSCSSTVHLSASFLHLSDTGLCCMGKLCNGFHSPNTGLRPTSCVAHLILAAILAITRM